MVAILGGLGAAFAWAASTLCSSRSTRMIGSESVVAWVMLTGLCVAVPWAALGGVPSGLDATSVVWLGLGGLGNVGGLLLAYPALRLGKVGIVAPIVSTEGAVAAVIAVAAGESLAVGTGFTLAGIALGVVLAASGHVREGATAGRGTTLVPALALAAACSFGLSLYGTGRASADLPVAWAVLPPRLAGVVVVAVPLIAASRLRLTRRALPLVVASGLAEVLGFASYALGARHGIAVASVLGSQFAAFSGIAAYFLFGERLTRVQLLGVSAIVVGVAVLTVLQT